MFEILVFIVVGVIAVALGVIGVAYTILDVVRRHARDLLQYQNSLVSGARPLTGPVRAKKAS